MSNPNSIKQTDYTIPKDGYVAFDALSLRQLIINRLNENKTFTDQNYIGSNLASIIDIVAYSYHTLIYYLNKTSTESLFSEAQLYENINRIVKLINYNPVGIQTSTLSFDASATSVLPVGTYVIPRYSYFYTNNVRYSLNEDVTIVKSIEGLTYLDEFSRRKLLYEGTFNEYPELVALGEEYETFTLTTRDLIDYFNVDVYVKPKGATSYLKYTRTPNIFQETNTALVYEVRVNENKLVEIKFGNDINGAKLQEGDIVRVYYLASSGRSGEVGAYAFIRAALNIYNTPVYNQIYGDTQRQLVNTLNTNQANSILITNTQSSTLFNAEESVDEIRQNAPKSFRTSNRLVTIEDFQNFIKERFSNVLTDVRVLNNWSYLSTYLKYYHDIGINRINETDRPLYNQIYFADACNFNNIYIMLVPRFQNGNFAYAQPGIKQYIIDAIQSRKVSTAEIVFIDPVYKALTFGITNAEGQIDIENERTCQLVIKRDVSVAIEDTFIKSKVINLIIDFFSTNKNQFGNLFDLRQLYGDILAIDGVADVYTRRVDGEQISTTSGLSFFIWNPVYPDKDKQVVINNYKIQDYEFAYFYNIENITDKIIIEQNNVEYQVLEY